MTRPTLSVCLIVRDEADMLGPCLESVARLADQLVVVDTGSTDDTVAIAEAHGAEVHHFAWVDDFAAARNASLDAAAGDFVLVLDADERLAPGAADAIRAVMAAEPADAPPTVYLPLIDNRDAAGQALGADFMPRLWRNRPGLRFTGRVHEQIGRGVDGLRRAFDDRIRIRHLGYDPALAAARGKRARNRALLEAERAERPDDPTIAFYIAKEDYAEGLDESALAGFRRAMRGSAVNLALSATLFAVECLRNLERFAEAVALAEARLARAPSYGDLWFVAGQAALEGGDPDRALALLENARRRPEGLAAIAFRDPSVVEWRADLVTARALVARGRAAGDAGDLGRAAQLFDRIRPRLLDDARLAADLDAAELAVLRRRPEDAWARLEPTLGPAPVDGADILLDLIQLAVEEAGLEPAYGLLVRALSIQPALLHRLPLVGAAAELAEALGDGRGRAQWLHICALLDSPHPEHYAALAVIREAEGDGEEAARLRDRARALGPSGADER